MEHVEAAWATRCACLGDKLVLLAVASAADEEGRCRLVPKELAPRVGMSPARVDGALAGLHRDGLVRARRWDDTGAWSVALLLEGAR